MKKYKRMIAFFLIFLSSCQRYYQDPICTGLSSKAPGNLWQPCLTYPFLSSPANDFCFDLVYPEKGKELSLIGMIDIALCNNPRLQQTWREARASAYNLNMQQRACFPTIIATESLTYTDVSDRGATDLSVNPENPSDIVNPADVTELTPGSDVLGYSKSWTQNLSFSFLVLDFGGREADIAQAKHALFASNFFHNRAIQDIILEVLQNYYFYVDAVEQKKAREDDLENAKINLAAALDLYLAGIEKRVDVLQAKSDFASAKLVLNDAERQEKVTFASLAKVLGLPVNITFNVVPLPEDLPTEKIYASLEELLELTKWKRPDLAADYALVLAKKAEKRSVLSDALPTLNVNVNLQRTNFFNRPSLNGHTYSSSLSLNIPLFNGFFYVNQIRKVKEEIQAAYAIWKSNESQAKLEVLTSYEDVETARVSIESAKEFLQFAKEAYELALGNYKEGTGNILDVIAAKATLSQAKAENIRSRTEWAVSVAQLGYATGALGYGEGC